MDIYTLDYLLSNPDLCSNSCFMQKAVQVNPSLIRYAKGNCYFPPLLLKDVFSSYKISVDDLYDNPDLCSNFYIMKFFPEYRLYCSFLSVDEKVSAIVSCLKSGCSISSLPFFNCRFGYNGSIDMLLKLCSYFSDDYDECNLDVQEYFYSLFDKFVDGIVDNRYHKNKKSFSFPSSYSLCNYIISSFDRACSDDSFSSLVILINDIYSFVDKSLSIDFITSKINNLYIGFLCTGSVDLDSVYDFCNLVLNYHRNVFVSSEKKCIFRKSSSCFNLSYKKRSSILNRKRLNIVSEYIMRGDYAGLGVSGDEYNNLLNAVIDDIINNKYIKKCGVIISNSEIDSLLFLFYKKGCLSISDVESVLGGVNNKISIYICKKFERFKLNFVDNFNAFSDNEFDFNSLKSKISFDYNNFLIYDKDRFYKNLASLLINVDDSVIGRIFSNIHISEILYLINFIDVFPAFCVSDFINILSFYDVVRDKIGNVFDHIGDLISLSNGYGSVCDLELAVLGDEIISVVGKHEAKRYFDFYLMMLDKKNSCIPPVYFRWNGYLFCSGFYSDIERLLIGHNVGTYSCIRIGSDTYKEVLLGSCGDVILIRDEDNHIVSRILVFRRGNLVQLVSHFGVHIPVDVFEEITRQIVKQAHDIGDNIDFVFVNSSSCDDNKYTVINDNRFVTCFPHADFFNTAFMFYGDNYMLADYDVECLGLYSKRRCPIIYNPNDFEITRIRALSAFIDSDNVSNYFLPFYSRDYSKFVCGEDWYLAILNDGSVEEVVLPFSDVAYDEIEKVKSDFLGFVK